MLKLPLDASDKDILAAVADWASVLAQERYADALNMLYRVTADEQPLTPDILESVFRNYGSVEPLSTGETFKVTPLEQARVPDNLLPTHDVTRYKEDKIDTPDEGIALVGEVWYDLPLNGEWSDLTATFRLYQLEDGLVLALEDVHVM